MTPPEYSHEVTIENNRIAPRRVWLEPWCEELHIEPGASIVLKAKGTAPGQLEIEPQVDCDIVFGWPTSSLKVFKDEVMIWESWAPHPPIPGGFTSKTFVKRLFGSGDGRSDQG